ncbi:hypothetical protein [Brochothrix thermosphacta]|uniref:hypothetical protein n=1 Tax=Brochothrix thermosphacta TaxID=2756 RepID=UPI000EC30D72|nr:hypothetical protein [Brochothrix thermosphacta]HCZ37970.1 hypothetical protein [Brochothrix thermosphacta]HCZ46604.1 hypothetical protein [Brochothrix thermosphacta]
MKKKKWLGKVIIILMIALIAAPEAVSAGSYSQSFSRGVKYMCWSKSQVLWTTSSTKITKSYATQQRSGLLVNLKGMKKTGMSTSKTHYYDSKTELLYGAQVAGVTLGWATTFIDRFTVTHKGKSSVKLNV